MYIFIIFFLFFSCFFSSVCFKQNLLCDTTTLSPLAASVNKYRHNIFHKKNTLHRNQNNRITVLRIKNKKEIDVVVILYKDRLLRFGFELIEYFAKLNNVKIEIIDNTMDKTQDQELMEDLAQIITVFSCKLQGKRKGKTKQL